MYVRAHDPRALNLLASGFTPRAVMKVVEANDDDFDFRQTGIIDREGNVVAHTGANCGKWAGHKVGPYYAAFGNWLTGPAVVEGLVEGFMAHPDLPLEDRLLFAIEGGRKAGGQEAPGNPKAERSAWLRVVGQNDYPEIDLRVDMHTDTVAELRSLLQEFRLYQSYYAQRSRNPQEAIPEEAFVAQLQ
jgi:uncharacterized Ntn-hydrolase superfamily protein